MRTLRVFIFLLLTSAAFGQYCDCYSYIYADANTGDLEADAYSDFPDCFDSCYVYVDLQVSDNSGSLYEQSQDAYDFGPVELTYFGYVSLNDEYEEQSSHEVDGYDGDFYYITEPYNNSDWVDIPPAPTIYANSVQAPNGSSEAYINYSAQPPVLISADMLVGPDYSATSNPNNANMPFNQDDMPYGANTFSFRGFMYGHFIPPSSYPIVVRTATPFDPVYGTRSAVCDENGEVQTFTIQGFEPSDAFTYTLPYSGVTDLSKGGTINIRTDQAADCQFTIGIAPNTPPPTGTNEVRDVLFNDDFAYMSDPGTTLPPQSPTYQSLDNSWHYYVAPNAWGHECTSFLIDGDNIGIVATSICLDSNLP